MSEWRTRELVPALAQFVVLALVIKVARASADGWEDAGGVAAQAQVLRRKAEALLQDKMKQLTGGMPLPPGLKLF